MEGTRLPAVNPYEDAKGRKYFFDNAKYILITLVVLAHFISPFKEEHGIIKALWVIINTLHMPTLIFISGFFAKSYIKSGVIKVQRPVTYTILYLAAQLTFGVFEAVFKIDDVSLSVLSARSSLWFLQCLIAWYILLPIIERFDPKWVMIGAFAIGLLIGYDSKVGHLASLSRIFVHLPFFLLGYYLKQEHIEKLFEKKTKIGLAVAAGVICIIALFIAPDLSTRLITCSYKYIAIPGVRDWPFVLRWCARALFYIAALVLGAAFLAWVPRIKVFFTNLGSRTLQVYILHRFLYMIELELFERVAGLQNIFDNFFGITFFMGLAVVTAYALSLKIFSYPFDFLQGIRIDRFLKKEKE